MTMQTQRFVDHVDVQSNAATIADGHIIEWDDAIRRWVVSDTLVQHISGIRNPHGSMVFRNTWNDASQYYKHDMAVDEGYMGVALTDTTDKLAPVGQGPEVFLYDGLSPTTSDTAKQLIQGAQYESTQPIFVHGYRIYTVTGNDYAIYSLTGSGTIQPILVFTADSTGWSEFVVDPFIVGSSVEFAILAFTTEPDPTPTTWIANYDYLLPNNEGIPLSGKISHATRLTQSLRINKTDDDGTDRSTELAGMDVGDIIDGAGMRWSIQVITDNTTWIDFTVAPAQQGAPAGVQQFSFETTDATPITHVEDLNYWSGNLTVRGLLGIDIPVEDIVPDAHQYGVDIKIQDVEYSTDWYILPSGGGSGLGSGGDSDSRRLDGGWSDSVYLPAQFFDGGDSTGQ